jgi:hypothetical protein
MEETRDVELGRELASLAEPDHGADYWREVRLQVADAGEARRFGLRRARARFAPRSLRFALIGLAMAAAAAAAILVGLPKTQGPQRVSAAEVLQRALSRCSSGQTVRSDVIARWYASDMWELEPRYKTILVSLLQLADGSYRIRFHAGPSSRSGVQSVAMYDAQIGVMTEREAGRAWRITSRYPPGPPDSPAAVSASGADLGAMLRAVSASTRLKLDEEVIGGRPAWIVTCTKGDLAGLPRTDADWPVYTIAVDKQTWLPVQFTVVQAGTLMFDSRSLRVSIDDSDASVSRDAFKATPSAADEVRRSDRGFTPVSLEAAAGTEGMHVVTPIVPSGYGLSGVWVAERSTSDNRVVEARDVFVMQFRSGFDALTISTRRVTNPYFTPESDPLDDRADPTWSEIARTETTLRAGAFAGATARTVVATDVSAPHLWAVKDGILLTIAGGATAKELLAIAESLKPYSDSSSPPAE